MNKVTVLTLGIVLSATPLVFAQEAVGQAPAAQTFADAQAPIEVGNKICPVSGEKLLAPGEKGDMGETVKYAYNGKIYNFCCGMCVRDFKKHPEKYSKIAEDEAAENK